VIAVGVYIDFGFNLPRNVQYYRRYCFSTRKHFTIYGQILFEDRFIMARSDGLYTSVASALFDYLLANLNKFILNVVV